tara:strand:- start:13158 stop:13487 length:330 start_codon:yes stop_codon:yes gene_type:complete
MLAKKQAALSRAVGEAEQKQIRSEYDKQEYDIEYEVDHKPMEMHMSLGVSCECSRSRSRSPTAHPPLTHRSHCCSRRQFLEQMSTVAMTLSAMSFFTARTRLSSGPVEG